ncbi:FadR/GntR family transcriptional regulator [Amycolatopsis alba]|uniref:FadR family transcriptional regulator n=1 Tax=Amycolatopsis alba DSM 44262 TaxID=1125972 RepID=A0A229S9F3_AMYAL|nr:FCD domain-containing protein [Amycolatopsis alba]OXM55566.1 FadR family transcriptional regulator [Amycolatopsis alba DSM 44262]
MTRHARIVDELGRLIVSGAFGTEQPIVPEDLGRRFSASRTVVREALRVLESKGMVAARPRVGTWTRPPEHWDAIDPDVIAWRVAGPERSRHLAELHELRLAIEPQAARMAAWHRCPDELAVLVATYGLMADAVDLRAFQEADRAFHAALLRASGNALIAQLHIPVVAALEEVPGDEVLSAHSLVVAAVLGKDGDGAESASRRLLETVVPYRSPAS